MEGQVALYFISTFIYVISLLDDLFELLHQIEFRSVHRQFLLDLGKTLLDALQQIVITPIFVQCSNQIKLTSENQRTFGSTRDWQSARIALRTLSEAYGSAFLSGLV